MTRAPAERLENIKRERDLLRKQHKEALTLVNRLRRERDEEARNPPGLLNIFEQRQRLAVGHLADVRDKLRAGLDAVNIVQHMLTEVEK